MTMVPGFVVVIGVGCGVPDDGIDVVGAVDGTFVAVAVAIAVPLVIVDAIAADTAIPPMRSRLRTLL